MFLIENDFIRGKIDTNTTLFHINYSNDFIIVQVYIGDITFGATNERICKEFSSLVYTEFEMNMMEELKFYLGLQIKQNI